MSSVDMIRAYQTEKGWVVAYNGLWLPGVYDAEATAQAAIRFADTKLENLEKRICQENAGEARSITMADLELVIMHDQ